MGPAPADAAPERQQRPVVTIIRCARPPARDAGAGAGLRPAPARPPGAEEGRGRGGGSYAKATALILTGVAPLPEPPASRELHALTTPRGGAGD